jgi:anti-sigma regulatory factor (Ser/Thr protein kinase)
VTETIDLRLRSGPRAPSKARRALDCLTGEFPPELLDDVRLLISEVVTNSYKHAPAGSEGLIGLHVEVKAGALRVEVRDAGGGFDPNSIPAGGPTTGWGLYLVHRIAGRWGVALEDACCVWFELPCERPPQGRETGPG